MDLSKLSAPKLQAEHDRRYEAHTEAINTLIALGYGHERYSETETRAKAGEASAQAYMAVWLRYAEVRDEMQRRMEWHGSLKPIKRAA